MNKETIIQNYLNGTLNDFEFIYSFDTLQVKNIKQQGVIYTPEYIIDHMLSLSQPILSHSIIEPSCGHGSFVFKIIHYIQEKYLLSSEELLQWFISHVTAIDLSPYTIADLKLMLSAFFLKHFNIHTDSNTFTNIICIDSLQFNNSKKYDLCIGNPPYVRTKNIDETYLKFLRQHFITCKKGNIDLYFAFIEHFFKQSKKLCFITPNSFLNNKSGLQLMSLIKDHFTHIIDFKEKIIFQDARTYSAIFVLSEDVQNNFIYSNDIETTTIKKNNSFFDKIKHNQDIIVLSEFATLCDFAYKVKWIDNGFFANFNDTLYPIEKEMITPHLKITKIQSNTINDPEYMIYPYDENKKIFSEDFIKENYPLTYNYLLIIKERLSQRDKGKTQKYESWFAYGRKQGLHKTQSKQLLLIPKLIGGNCKPIFIDSTFLNQHRGFTIVSGCAIEVNSDTQSFCDYLLSQAYIDFLKLYAKPWPGKHEPYYASSATLIKSFYQQFLNNKS